MYETYSGYNDTILRDHNDDHDCAAGTRKLCKKLGNKVGAKVRCTDQSEICDPEFGRLYTGRKYCAFKGCGCCVPVCGPPLPACEALGGICKSRRYECDEGNQWHIGPEYCDKKSCGCCAPINCEKETLGPCLALNGTCIQKDDYCDGTVVTGEWGDAFCNYSDTCKCCIPYYSSQIICPSSTTTSWATTPSTTGI